MRTIAVASVLLAGAFGMSGVADAKRAAGCDAQAPLSLYRYCGKHIPASRLPLTFAYNPTGAPSGVRSSSGADKTPAAISAAISAWDDSWPVLSSGCAPLCSAGSTTATFGPDARNTIVWDHPSRCGGDDASSLAVTCTWYDASSGAGSYRVKEVDIILNPAFAWAFPSFPDPAVAAGDVVGLVPDVALSGWYDVQSILTHEFGHAIGLEHIGSTLGPWPRDLFDTGAYLQTMYRYYYPGTTNKRTLEVGDIAGELRVAMDSSADTA